MNPSETAPNTEFVNPVLNEQTQPPPYTANYSTQPGNTGQTLQTVVVTSPVFDPYEQELETTSRCAWATLGSCFFPISIVALVFTCKAKDAYRAGNKEDAEKYDSVATKLSWSSCIIGTVFWIVGISIYIYVRTKYT